MCLHIWHRWFNLQHTNSFINYHLLKMFIGCKHFCIYQSQNLFQHYKCYIWLWTNIITPISISIYSKHASNQRKTFIYQSPTSPCDISYVYLVLSFLYNKFFFLLAMFAHSSIISDGNYVEFSNWIDALVVLNII